MENRNDIRRIMISVNVINEIYDSIAKNLKIRDDMLSLLYALDDEKLHTQADICKEWNIPRSTISSIVQECIDKKLLTLEVKENDKKHKYLRITQYGKMFSNEILGSIYEIENKAYENSKNNSNYVEFLENYSKALYNETNNYFNELNNISKRNELDIHKQDYRDYILNIEELYYEAFPKTERVPLELLFELNNIDVLVFTYEGQFVGFAVMLDKNDISYLLYFAVSSKYRGKGFGSQALELIKNEKHSMRILADLEVQNFKSNNKLQRIKRKKFYSRAGFMESGITYFQKNTEFEILCFGGEVTKENISSFWNNVPEQIYKYYKE